MGNLCIIIGDGHQFIGHCLIPLDIWDLPGNDKSSTRHPLVEVGYNSWGAVCVVLSHKPKKIYITHILLYEVVRF